MIGNWEGVNENGDNTSFLQMMDWLENSDLSNDENYEYICSLIDIDCFIDYYCLELFIANSDWPVNNMRCYQFQDGKWRWIFYDGDNGLQDMDFDVFENATSTLNIGWPNNLRSTLMFRKLLENERFREQFVSRLIDLMDGPFAYENTRQYFENAASVVREEVPNQASRFNRPNNLAQWEALIAIQDHFLSDRVANMRERLDAFVYVDDFGLNDLLSCYPNPFFDDLYFYVDKGLNTDEIAIYDLTGRKVFVAPCVLNEGKNRITIHPNLSAGIYLLKVGEHVQRIVRY